MWEEKSFICLQSYLPFLVFILSCKFKFPLGITFLYSEELPLAFSCIKSLMTNSFSFDSSENIFISSHFGRLFSLNIEFSVDSIFLHVFIFRNVIPLSAGSISSNEASVNSVNFSRIFCSSPRPSGTSITYAWPINIISEFIETLFFGKPKCWPNSSKLGRMLSPNCLPCSRWKLKSLLFQQLLFNRLLRVSLHICSSRWAKVLRGVYTQIWWLPILWFLFSPTWLFPCQFLASPAASDSNTSSQLRLCFSSSCSTP